MLSLLGGRMIAMATYVAPAGEFTRDTKYITTRITADGRDGYPVEPGRYRLAVAPACPRAHPAIIVRPLPVPAIVDVPTGAVVTNDFAQMTLDLSTEWSAYHRDGAPQLYPEQLRTEID